MQEIIYGKYLRKSTEEAERQVLSLDSQDDNIMRLFGKYKISKEKFRESKSAFKPYNRPDFRHLMNLIDAGKINGILAWHPDRLARNAIEAAEIIWRIEQGFIKDMKFASGFTFENTPEGIMMLQMVMSQSQYFSAKLSKDVKRGMVKKVQMGGLIGKAPEGYLNKRDSMSGRGDAIVIKDPERFDLIRKAFDLFLTGEYSVQAIHKIMTEEWGYTTPQRRKIGGTAMARSNLYNVFRNEKYAGLVRDLNDPEKFYKGDYPAMITLEEYDKVQTLLGRKGMPRLAARKQFALRGFIRCADCGYNITAQSKRKVQKNGNVHHYTYYHCTGKYKGCSQKSVYVPENKLWAQLLELLDSYELDPEMYDWAMDAFREFAAKEVTERNNVQATQNRAVADVQTQLDKLLDMATRGLIDDEQYKAKSAKLKAELGRLQEEQADIMHRVKNWYEIVTETFEKLTYAGKKFTEGDVGNKKDILLAIGENPVLMNGNLQIASYKWLVPVANNAKSIRAELEKVRTSPQQIQKASKEALRLKWCA